VAEVRPALAALSPAACAAELAARFPAVFAPGASRPLKLRIQADIQLRAPGIFARKVLSIVLQRHTTTNAYLKALLSAPHRVDLDGMPAGDVAAEHAQAAGAELERRRALHESRRAAERDAQREARDAARRAGEAADKARGERAALLRAHETTTLTRKNFCALKGVSEAELDAVLEQARQERAQRAQAPHPGPPVDRTTARGPQPSRATAPHPRVKAEKPAR